MLKSIIAFFMSLLTVFSIMPNKKMTDSDNSEPKVDSTYSVEYTNSFSEMVAKAINESSNMEENEGSHISNIDIDDNEVTIDYVSESNSNIVFDIIDEETEKVVFSNSAVALAESDSTSVDIDQELPEYYIVKATMVDDDFNPISGQYNDTDHTEWYKEFSELETNDFSSELVLNLDETDDTNFAVFTDSVKFVDNNDENNVIVSSDDESGTYVFSDTDDEVDRVQIDDVLCYGKDTLDNMIIGKVIDKHTDGDNTIIKLEDSTIDETFQIIKIDYDEDECLFNSENGLDSNNEINEDGNLYTNDSKTVEISKEKK